MPSKIETSLTPEQLQEFFRRCAQLKGTKLADIQALAGEFGIDVSIMSAKSFRDGDRWKTYLEELTQKREKAEAIAAIAKHGLSLTDAAAVKLAVRINDDLDKEEELSLDDKSTLSLAITRLRTGDQRAKFLEAVLREKEEQIGRLVAEREERAETKRKLQETIAAAKAKSGLTRETLRKIEEEAKLL
jgi:hypothetical protein